MALMYWKRGSPAYPSPLRSISPSMMAMADEASLATYKRCLILLSSRRFRRISRCGSGTRLTRSSPRSVSLTASRLSVVARQS